MEHVSALTESEAIDLLAFLLTAARTLLDEPVDYGPLRLLQAAGRICETAGPRLSPPVRDLMSRLAVEIPHYTAQRNGQPDAYLRFLDGSCRSVARVLMTHRGVPGREP